MLAVRPIGCRCNAGGIAIPTTDAQTLNGDLAADKISSISLTLDNGSVLNGAVNAAHTAKAAELTLDGASNWNVTADSYLTCLSDPDGISGTAVGNINGNGHIVYYDEVACTALSGGTYGLGNGGYSEPGS